MSEISLDVLVDRLRTKRGGRGVRATAAEIGISAATLSRIENGNYPDLETFGKVCKWLDLDPSEVLGFRKAEEKGRVLVHFKKENTVKPETAEALAKLILVAQEHMLREEEV